MLSNKKTKQEERLQNQPHPAERSEATAPTLPTEALFTDSFRISVP